MKPSKSVKAALLACLVVALTGHVSPAQAQEAKKIVYAGFGGTWQTSLRKHAFDPFENATGIKVVDVGGTSLSKIKAMVEAKQTEWDVAVMIGSWLITGNKEKLFEELDLSLIDSKGYPPDTVQSTAVAVDAYSILMGYNTDAFKGRPAPQSWADFWNVEKFPGGRAVFDKPRYMLEFATLADGVPKDKLYPIDIDRAFRKLDELKPLITLFFRQFDQARQLLATGAVTMSVASPAVISEAKRQGAPVEMVWNQGVVAYDYLTIPKGTKNKSAAMKYIAWYANNGEAQAKMARDYPQGPINPSSLQHLSAAERDIIPTQHLDQLVPVNWAWWADNLSAVEERWNEWKLD